MAWFLNINGEFSIRTTYKALCENDISARSRLNKEVWDLLAHQKIKVFMWLIINNALLTNYARFKRGMSNVDNCALCGIYLESTLYVLHDCKKAKDLWKNVGHSLIKRTFFHCMMNGIG